MGRKPKKKITRRKNSRKRISKSPKRKAKSFTKRETKKYPGLEKRYFSKVKQEYHDIDYVDQLNDKEKEWLNNFMEEYAGGRVNHKGKKVHKKLNTKKGRKVLYDLNNQRQRDIYGQAKAAGKTVDADPKFMVEVLQAEYDWADTTEDQIIEKIDSLKTEEPLD